MKGLQHAESLGTGTARSAGGNSFGLPRAASRWVVEHTGLVTLLTVLLVAALCVGQWWLSYRHAQDWSAAHPGQPVPLGLWDTGGLALMLGAVIWIRLQTLSDKEGKTRTASGKADWWRFAQRERQRILQGRPFGARWLWLQGLFGLLGFALGVALALRVTAATAWRLEAPVDPGSDRGFICMVLLAVFLSALGVWRMRNVLFLVDCDYFVGDRAKEIAQAVAEVERAESEAEREEEGKAITWWDRAVLMGGFLGGVFLAGRWLPEADGNAAGQAIVSGLIVSVTALYLPKTKPRGWQIWLGVALAVAVGFLVFIHLSWHRSPVYLLLGTLWGAGVGAAATLLYLRKLRRMRSRLG